MAGIDVIKSYLVSLGFQVENAQYQKAQNTIKDMSRLVESQTGSMSQNYIKAGGIIVSTLTSIGVATVALMDKMGQSDINYQLFATRMFMTAEAGKKFKIALDTIGHSLEEITWNKTLSNQFKELLDMQKGLENTPDKKKQIEYLQSIRHEYNKLKINMTYSTESIVYELTKMIFKSSDLKTKFSDFNKTIQEKMPEWSKKIAGWLSSLFSIGETIIKVFGKSAEGLQKIWDILPPLGREFVIFGGILTGIFVSGPIGRALLIIGALSIALEDFYGYMEGKDTSTTLAPIWGTMLEIINNIAKGAAIAALATEHLWDVFGKSPKERGTFSQNWEAFKREIGTIMNAPNMVGQRGDPIQRAAREAMKPPTPAQNTGKQEMPKSMIKFESGGNYTAEHPKTKAYGKAQIMPSNWPAWAKEAGLPEGSKPTPENQDIVVSDRWNKILKKHGGNEQLASAEWFGGPRASKRLASGDMSVLNWTDANKTKMSDYIKNATGKDYDPNYLKDYSAMSQKYTTSSQASSVDNSLTIGNVTINAPKDASSEQLYASVKQAIKDAHRENIQYRTRSMQPAVQ